MKGKKRRTENAVIVLLCTLRVDGKLVSVLFLFLFYFFKKKIVFVLY